MVIIVIQFSSCSFTCELNSPEASYKVSTSITTKATDEVVLMFN
jgi:hypothetical protein